MSLHDLSVYAASSLLVTGSLLASCSRTPTGPPEVPFSNDPSRIVDLDGDGHAALVTAHRSKGEVWVWFGSRAGFTDEPQRVRLAQSSETSLATHRR